jgi:multisubunit Na+/H+ antiporter MnhB subunit
VTIGFLVDVILAAGLVALGLRVVTGRALFRDIVMFVVFGLTMALAWARLGSPDLALAEAAIGAGLTGGLMLIAYRRLRAHGARDADAARSGRSQLSLPVALLAGAAVAVIGLVALRITPALEGGGAAALAEGHATGLGNPVTAVLLVFRNLDTLLEMAVLLVALLGAWAVTGRMAPEPVHRVSRETPLVAALLSAIVPLSVLVAMHLLLVGTAAPGGAFQAGAVLAGCGVLLVLTGTVRPTAAAGVVTRVLVVAGVAAFVAIGVGVLAFDRPLLGLPGAWAVYLIETAMMLSIAVTLTLLFARSQGLTRERR